MAFKSIAVRFIRAARRGWPGRVSGALPALWVGAALLSPVGAQPPSGSAPPAPAAAGGAMHRQLIDEVVAVVNTDAITRRELLDRADLVERTSRAQRHALPPRAELLSDVLEQLVMERVQMQAARESGIRASDADVDRAVESVARRNNLSVARLKDRLAQSGLAYDKYRDDLRQEIVLAHLREREVDAKVQVQDSEIDAQLARPRAGLDPSAEPAYDIAQILVPVRAGASARQRADAAAKARGLLKRALSGADFAKLAREHAVAQGWHPISQLPAAIANAVLDLEAGQVAGRVIESPAGFHVLKLLDKRAPSAAAPAWVQQTRVRHILIKTGPTLSADDARRRLAGLRERIVHGEDFGAAARRVSQDGSASAGGDLGWVTPGQLVPEFEQAMNRLEPGEVSETVQSPFGLHLIQVQSRRQAEMPPARQRDEARAAIREQKLQAAYEDWLRQLRDAAHVEYRLDRQP